MLTIIRGYENMQPNKSFKATKKPVAVQAIRWNGTRESYFDVMSFIGELTPHTMYYPEKSTISILENSDGGIASLANVGDYIVKHADGKLQLMGSHAFEANYDFGGREAIEVNTFEKTLHNSDASGARENVKDIHFFGDGDTFKLISKASSEAEGWMKSTKAMEVDGVGCVVQVTTQQGSSVAEALTFVPGVVIADIDGDPKNGRKIVKSGRSCRDRKCIR